MIIEDVTRPAFKIVFIGDSGVGKSSIIGKYNTGIMPLDINPTVGAAYVSKIVPFEDIELELRIWDTAGQETYHSLTPIYFRGSSIGFVVFDITQRTSFDNVANWIKQLREFAGEEVVTVIVANKIDLEHKRVVSSQEMNALAKDMRVLCAETSAKDGAGIQKMLERAIEELIENNNDIKYEVTVCKRRLDQKVNSSKKTECC